MGREAPSEIWTERKERGGREREVERGREGFKGQETEGDLDRAYRVRAREESQHRAGAEAVDGEKRRGEALTGSVHMGEKKTAISCAHCA